MAKKNGAFRKKTENQRDALSSIAPSPPIPEVSIETLEKRNIAWIVFTVLVIAFLAVRNLFLNLPYFTPIEIGPLKLAPFGPLVASSVLMGMHLIHYWCLRYRLDWQTLSGSLLWIVGIGLVGSHFIDIAAYDPKSLLDLGKLLDIRVGFSSFGGFICGALTAIYFFRKYRLPIGEYAEAVLYGFTGAWILGRAGCFSVHDHPGQLTDFFLGVPLQGGLRHDLGLYEMLYTIPMFLVLHLTTRKKRPFPGYVIAFVALTYAPVRFLLDFLRIEDSTYGGLTPAQWACFPLFFIGIWMFYRGKFRQA